MALPEHIRKKIEARRKEMQGKLVDTTQLKKEQAENKQLQQAQEQEQKEIDEVFKIHPSLEKIEGFDPKVYMEKAAQLKTAVEKRAPGVANYLQDILKFHSQFQEISYLLNDHQLQLLVSGILFVTDTDMAEVVTRSRKRKLTIDEAERLF